MAVFALLLGSFTVYYLRAPRLYRSEAVIRAQRQQALPSLVRQGASDEAPTRSAYELIHSRENLLDLLRSTGLLDGAPHSPGLLERFLKAIGIEPGTPDDDPNAPLVRKLDKALDVTTGDGTVKISLDWSNAQQAYRLVGAAAQSFLEARYLQEVTTIDDSIGLLKARLGPLREQLAEAIEDAQRRGAAMAELMPPPVVAPSPSIQANDALRRLEAAIEAKARAIRDIEDFRRRRLLDLQAQIEERRGQLAEAHPTMVGLRAEVAGLQQESRQVEVLREEERNLRDEYATRHGADDASRAPGLVAGLRVASSAAVEQSERVRDARFQYQQMVVEGERGPDRPRQCTRRLQVPLQRQLAGHGPHHAGEPEAGPGLRTRPRSCPCSWRPWWQRRPTSCAAGWWNAGRSSGGSASTSWRRSVAGRTPATRYTPPNRVPRPAR